MHPYATDSHNRKIVPIVLAITAVAITWVVNAGVQFFKVSFPWWLQAPSTMGVYAFIYYWFNQSLWRKNILRKLNLIKVPDLNGIWSGYVTSSYDDHAEKYGVNVFINQTWSDLSIKLSTDSSYSASRMAALYINEPDGIVLTYSYQNEPNPGVNKDMTIHRGTTRVILDEDTLYGKYYTGRERKNDGYIELQKES